MDDGNTAKQNDRGNFAPRHRTPRRYISPSFIGLVLIMAISGGAMYWNMPLASAVLPFIFVVSGWVIALCLHEFGHAIVAYHGGDANIAQTGYLSLDPLSYTHAVYSIVMPVLFIVMGFIALPGGAVYVRTGRLRSRYWESATFAAGPLMSLLCLCVACAPFALGLSSAGGAPIFWISLAVLAGFLALSIIWNLLPIPGLDGWGIMEPYMSANIRIAVAKWRQIGPLLLIMAILLFRPFGMFVAKAAIYILELMDVPGILFIAGMRQVMILNIFQ